MPLKDDFRQNLSFDMLVKEEKMKNGVQVMYVQLFRFSRYLPFKYALEMANIDGDVDLQTECLW